MDSRWSGDQSQPEHSTLHVAAGRGVSPRGHRAMQPAAKVEQAGDQKALMGTWESLKLREIPPGVSEGLHRPSHSGLEVPAHQPAGMGTLV